MGFDPKNPHKWFTAGEVAELARVQGIAEVPTTKSGMIKWIKRNAAADPSEYTSMSRRRAGQKGGGGTEYYWALFCDAGPEISDALDAEVSAREAAELAERRALAVGMFSPDDEQLMRDAASALYGHISRFELVGARWVRRSNVRVRNRKYYGRVLEAFEGRAVLVIMPVMLPPHPAFVWIRDLNSERLEAHGKDGFIGMTYPADEPEGAYSSLGLSIAAGLE